MKREWPWVMPSLLLVLQLALHLGLTMAPKREQLWVLQMVHVLRQR